MSAGITKADAERALAAGWSRGSLLGLHREARDAGASLELVDGDWAFLLRDKVLFYRSWDLRSFLYAEDVGPRATAYCDGSGTTGEKPAGIGVAIYQPERATVLIAENIGPGTNNRAELCAIWRALRAFPQVRQPILIRSDSEYAIGALTQDWARNANVRLIENIRQDLALRGGAVEFEHVKGHAGHEGNEVADQLANIGRKLVTRVSEYEG